MALPSPALYARSAHLSCTLLPRFLFFYLYDLVWVGSIFYYHRVQSVSGYVKCIEDVCEVDTPWRSLAENSQSKLQRVGILKRVACALAGGDGAALLCAAAGADSQKEIRMKY